MIGHPSTYMSCSPKVFKIFPFYKHRSKSHEILLGNFKFIYFSIFQLIKYGLDLFSIHSYNLLYIQNMILSNPFIKQVFHRSENIKTIYSFNIPINHNLYYNYNIILHKLNSRDHFIESGLIIPEIARILVY